MEPPMKKVKINFVSSTSTSNGDTTLEPSVNGTEMISLRECTSTSTSDYSEPALDIHITEDLYSDIFNAILPKTYNSQTSPSYSDNEYTTEEEEEDEDEEDEDEEDEEDEEEEDVEEEGEEKKEEEDDNEITSSL